MILNTTLEDIKNSLAAGKTCVINITADWCSDCIDQAPNLSVLSDALQQQQIDCYSLSVQSEKNVYLSPEHQDFTMLLGGHGFPRTVFAINGEIVDADNVEVISQTELSALSKVFLAQL